ncbi:MAG: class II D-tagatose-bisphosphate aldolase non-catalytic subunit [Boseongicola sp.]
MPDISALIERNRAGIPTGLPCFCTANEHVLHAVMQYAASNKVPVVIEATCNQVNQDGGYTGICASDYANWIYSLANQYGVARADIVLGGDHLGPNPWRHLSAAEAMAKAEVLVRDYVKAGFKKIHLDASMACGEEPTPSFETVAARAAQLCRIAEDAAPAPEKLLYVIGTEVPIPGGETDDMDHLAVTPIDRFHETIDTHREAFQRYGLSHVWPRIVSIVTQPGVDFSHTAVHRFKPDDASELSKAILKTNGFSFEAHSTDYQPTAALAELVTNHFFFLKVGPELTFRMREAVFALAAIEDELQVERPSGLIGAIDNAMDEDHSNWASYYRGAPNEVSQLRHFSYSDRMRYYWTVPEVKQALGTLLINLEDQRPPETIVSQHFASRGFGNLSAPPRQLLTDHINLCVSRYYSACGY